MNNKTKIFFLVVVVLFNLLLMRFLLDESIGWTEVISAISGGIVAVLAMSYLQRKGKFQD